MTSTDNYFDTISFFEQNNYFGYNRNSIKFFTQENLPIINTNGKLVLSETHKVLFASNGNGNLFSSLRKANLLDDMTLRKLQWLFVGGIDNVLLKNVDPLLLGLTIATNNEIASKSIFKEQPLEKTAVYCRNLGKPSILYYENIDL